MHKYHFNVKVNDLDNNAGSKATEDCRTILIEKGFKDLEVSFNKVWYMVPYNAVKLLSILTFYALIIRSGSFIFVQYPLRGINKFFKYFDSKNGSPFAGWYLNGERERMRKWMQQWKEM